MDRTTRHVFFKTDASFHLHTNARDRHGARLKAITLLVVLAAVFVLIGVSRGRSAIQVAADKPEAICDPTECRISESKRPANCSCRYSVVLIDLSGKDLKLTNVENGVDFDLNSEGSMKQTVSWTTANSTSAFLFLDRNGNGVVDNAGELFGNLSSQLPSSRDPDRNGFLALARYDRPYLGGNGDGVISSQDAIFTKSKLWWDSNHNGISEPNELHGLKDAGIEEISLDYRNVTGKDQYGNLIRYEADIYGASHKKIGTAYDVLLLPPQ